ncbi:hypothetical protein [Clostridium sp. YIM B02500]|uniref:hypothetical protein n=1 Tax=Clostridium sp. YIM B02500 TaxID=2910681 RepID=UPI001EEDBA8B|nr:hypothetical protein [Clostridium sp. YIM B02500]
MSIVLSYPKDAFQKNGALKTFIPLDKSLAPLDILTQYADCWAIQPFFRDCKIYRNDSNHFNTGYKSANKIQKIPKQYIFTKLQQAVRR